MSSDALLFLGGALVGASVDMASGFTWRGGIAGTLAAAAGYRVTSDPAEIEAMADEMHRRGVTTLDLESALRRTVVRLRASREAADPVQLSLGEVA